MTIIWTLLWFLVALGILVTFHEYGHFYAARRCGVKVLRFSVGFGKPLYTWVDRHGTEFTLATIPLGGYVKMLDEREGEVSPHELPQAFTQKTVWQRMLIVVAGPLANFILAIAFYFILAMIGIKGVAPVIGEVKDNSLAAAAQLQANDEIVSIDGKATPTWSAVFEQLVARIGDSGNLDIEVRPFAGEAEPYSSRVQSAEIDQWLGYSEQPDVLAELGIEPVRPATDWHIDQVIAGGSAERAGIQQGDKLLAADGEQLSSWSRWVDYVRARPGEAISLLIERDGQQQGLTLVPDASDEQGQQVGKVGLGAKLVWPEGMSRELDYSVMESIAYGFSKTGEQAMVILGFLKKLLLLDISVKNMGGTVTIAQVAGDTAEAGLTYFLAFLAFFSVSLGVFNLLPIPVLDGGHLLFYVIEAVKGKPLPEKIQMLGYQIGLFIVVGVMLLAHYNDLVRLLS